MKIFIQGTDIEIHVFGDTIGATYTHIPRRGEIILLATKKFRVVEVETEISTGYRFEIKNGTSQEVFEPAKETGNGKISDVNIYVEEI